MRSGDNKKDEIRQIKSPDSISVELLETLDDNGIDKITKLLNEIYDIRSDSYRHLQIYIYCTAKATRGNKSRHDSEIKSNQK